MRNPIWTKLAFLDLLLVSQAFASARDASQPHPPRDLISDINSFFGITPKTTQQQTAVSVVLTAPPTSSTPALQTATYTSQDGIITTAPSARRIDTTNLGSTSTDNSQISSDVETDSAASSTVTIELSTTSDTSTTQSTSSASSTSAASSTSFPSSTSTSPATPTQILPSNAANISSADPHNNDNRVPPVGIAIAIVFCIIIILGLAYILYRRYPSIRGRVAAMFRPRRKSSSRPDEEQWQMEKRMLRDVGGEMRSSDLSRSPPSISDYSGKPRGSLDTLSLEPRTPASILDRHAAPLPPIPMTEMAKASPGEGQVPTSLMVKIPRKPVPGSPPRSYTPFRPEGRPLVAVAMPLSRPAITVKRGLTPPVELPASNEISPTRGIARRISGVHELS